MVSHTYQVMVWSCYVCPYTWRAAEWLERVQDKLDDDWHITWKSFLLEQVNSRRGAQWKAWQDSRFTSRDIPSHEAAKSIHQAFEAGTAGDGLSGAFSHDGRLPTVPC